MEGHDVLYPNVVDGRAGVIRKIQSFGKTHVAARFKGATYVHRDRNQDRERKRAPRCRGAQVLPGRGSPGGANPESVDVQRPQHPWVFDGTHVDGTLFVGGSEVPALAGLTFDGDIEELAVFDAET